MSGPWDQTEAAGSRPRWGFRDLGARAPHPGSYNPSPRRVPVRAPAPATDPGGPGPGTFCGSPPPPESGVAPTPAHPVLGRGGHGAGRRDPGAPQLLDLLLLEVIDALAPLLGLLLETPALLKGGDAVLHLLLLVLAHLAPELVRVPQAPRGLLLRLQPLLLDLLSLSPGGGTPAAPREPPGRAPPVDMLQRPQPRTLRPFSGAQRPELPPGMPPPPQPGPAPRAGSEGPRARSGSPPSLF